MFFSVSGVDGFHKALAGESVIGQNIAKLEEKQI